ncbi:hypothetical protein PV726_06105 [Streptomyces europaeiscabiei]|uniref:hypothetical protein n=1 Tax=Streptomyces europaeiscabiei TaxID=146819 RepID=UPI0029AA1624|nr:hypothetical protein [Streptomyces europaeiscabiei]MDX3689915.1 hypothetical protein [Streptomyces europaeiscabiei]
MHQIRTSTAPAATPTDQRFDRDRAIAALPEVVDEAMRNTIADHYTPELAAQVADFVAAELRQPADGTLTPSQTPCPDGITWCDGDPVNHTDDDDHRHQGAEHTLNGSYLCDPNSDGIATFYLAKWHDSQPHLVFQGTGLWGDINLTQVDELIGDAVPWLTQLIATRRHLAILLDPGSTPFTQTDDQQTASAAFCVATDAMRIALDKSPDPAGLLQAMRTYLDMAEAEGTA